MVAAYPRAHTIHLVMDNLNTHHEKSLIDLFGPRAGRAVWRRLTVHYTPKHGSWLNQAEIELSLVSRQCLGFGVEFHCPARARHYVRQVGV